MEDTNIKMYVESFFRTQHQEYDGNLWRIRQYNQKRNCFVIRIIAETWIYAKPGSGYTLVIEDEKSCDAFFRDLIRPVFIVGCVLNSVRSM